MKILLIFIDMIRVDHLSLYNDKIEKTSLDLFFENLGGTILTNCYTPSPDTPRSMACLQSGLLPYLNGCDSRVKWPRYFMKSNIETIFDIAVGLGYKVNLCATQSDIETGLFKFKKNENISIYTNIAEFTNAVDLSENTLSFIAIDDYHSAIDDYGGTSLGIKQGQKAILYSLNNFLTPDVVNKCEYCFFFSDHGHALQSEIANQKNKLDLLNDGRTKLFMFYHNTNDKKIIKDSRLASILDLYASVIDLIGSGDLRQGFSFFRNKQRDLLHIEDHADFRVSPEQIVSQWRVISETIDVRTNVLETLNKSGEMVDIHLIRDYLGYVSPSFSYYAKQIDILKMYEKMKQRKTHYFNGLKRANRWTYYCFKIRNKLFSCFVKMFNKLK
ncbi:hypothetical protein AE938_05205 [Bacteroides fragilis]|jgi:putative uncharacterized protein wcfV|uniref:hypothetical protein n=1 Tax=Bacteroides fragilis TaxID=817 RepID=UPI001E868912|nr:hypothetical protein [Bacteroides fragilis]MBY2898268.1 hypothetical protein [Bacteroides fragilis]